MLSGSHSCPSPSPPVPARPLTPMTFPGSVEQSGTGTGTGSGTGTGKAVKHSRLTA